MENVVYSGEGVRKYDFAVISQDVDFTGHAKISSLICNILNAAGEDARRHGFGIGELSKRNLGWVLSRIGLEVDRALAENEPYTVETWVTDYTPLRTTRCFRLVDGDGKCFGRGVSYWCLLDYVKRSLAPMDSVRSFADTSITDIPHPCADPVKLRPLQVDPCSSHKVKYMDIDFNRHMNTLRYVELMLDEMPIDFVSGGSPVRCDFHFLKETLLGDTLDVLELVEGESYRFELKRADGNVAVLAKFSHLPCNVL